MQRYGAHHRMGAVAPGNGGFVSTRQLAIGLLSGLTLGLVFTTVAATADGANGIYAQELVRETAAGNPELSAVSVYVTPPKTQANVVIASTAAAQLRAAAGAEVNAVIKGSSGKVVHAPTGTEVLLPLRDVSGDTIGALALTYPAQGSPTDETALRNGERIRDGLHRRIAHVENLFDRYPWDPKVSDHTYAQQLVQQTMAKHPELEIFALHATAPGGNTNMIIGSNIGRIGKVADDDDLRAIRTGKPNLEVNDAGNRFEVESQLRDSAGRVIGAVGVVYAYKAGDDKQALRARAEKLDAEVEAQIPDSASLFEPAH
jgi:hypothetical protein